MAQKVLVQVWTQIYITIGYLDAHMGLSGWSTNIPSYNPVDIVQNIRCLMKGEGKIPILPWRRGFKGTTCIKKTGVGKYEITGIAKKINDTTVEIIELPIRRWSTDFTVI